MILSPTQEGFFEVEDYHVVSRYRLRWNQCFTTCICIRAYPEHLKLTDVLGVQMGCWFEGGYLEIFGAPQNSTLILARQLDFCKRGFVCGVNMYRLPALLTVREHPSAAEISLCTHFAGIKFHSCVDSCISSLKNMSKNIQEIRAWLWPLGYCFETIVRVHDWDRWFSSLMHTFVTLAHQRVVYGGLGLPANPKILNRSGIV